MDLGPVRTPAPIHLSDVLPEHTLITPIADEHVIDLHGDPAAGRRSTPPASPSFRFCSGCPLASVPLVLCDVLRWPATEVAELLGTTMPSINSALQRARATMADAVPAPAQALTDGQQRLLARYVDAFERYDMEALSRLLHDDVIQSMPPYAMWLQGRDDVLAWWAGPGAACEGSKLLAGWANGCPAFAQYRVDPAGGHAPWALQVLELRGDLVAEFHAFLDTEAFERFGFPAHL